MDSKLFRRLEHKVTQLAPAIFAENMVMVITDNYNIPWNPTFATEDDYDAFFNYGGIDIVILVEDVVHPWYKTDLACQTMWLVNEEKLCKLLYLLKTKFCKKSDEDAKKYFLIYCASMIYLSLKYYKKGVTSALTIVFFEVYFLACYYSKLMNFKCDFISTLDEIL